MENHTLAKPLSDRLDELLADIAAELKKADLDSTVAEALLKEAEHLRPEIDNQAAAGRSTVLDPGLGRAEIATARRKSEEARVDAERLADAINRLEGRFTKARALEKEAARQERYESALQQRDEVAERIRKEYPALQSGLTHLCNAIMASNAAVDAVNNDLPEGAEPLHRPEGHARGFHDRGSYDLPVSTSTYRLVQSQVPDLAAIDKSAWPPVMSWQNHVRSAGKMFSLNEVIAHWRKNR